VTPWYQLTRVIWWPRRRAVAVASAAIVVGVTVGLIAALGWYPATADAARADVLTGLAFGVTAGAVAGVGVRRFRRQWAELEVLSDVDRLRAIHAVHFGEDVGSERLALATLEFASWQRRWIEARRPYGIGAFAGVFAGQLLFATWMMVRVDAWGGAVAVGALAGAMTLATFRADRARTRLPGRLWDAEWYARRRLGRLDPPPA